MSNLKIYIIVAILTAIISFIFIDGMNDFKYLGNFFEIFKKRKKEKDLLIKILENYEKETPESNEAEIPELDIKAKIKLSIDKISKKIELYKEVKDHLIKGGAARGIVFEYSENMTTEEVENLIENLEIILVYLRNIYSELIINEEIQEIDNDLKEVLSLNLEEFNKTNLSNFEEYLEELLTKYK